ncbi:MAG: hypothetical protein HYR85_20935 [Planctomycetes bacterium]|nr:hypothetical protein [Planctomycetota bacterium]MBI3844903.1 hypothetical protein [Planctomycetota bacterium]
MSAAFVAVARTSLSALACVLLSMSLARAQSTCGEWTPGLFPIRGVFGEVYTSIVFDDGSGPALYVAGSFKAAGTVATSSIAKWDGSAWSSLGSGLVGTPRTAVIALSVFDDGSGSALYAAGSFTSAGGTPVSNIARWNGSSWSALGTGLDRRAFGLTVFDDGSGPALYAAGAFTQAGTATTSGIAKWNGHAWSAVGSFARTGAVFDILGFDDGTGAALYAAGRGFRFGSSTVGVMRWNGSAWSSTPIAARTIALATFDAGTGAALYGGGGGQSSGFVNRWDGSAWTGVGDAFQGPVYSLSAFDDGLGSALVATGNFRTVGTIVDVGYVAQWTGSAWAPLGGRAFNGGSGVVTATGFDDGQGMSLFVGGFIGSTASGIPTDGIARWNGSSWSAVGGGVESSVLSLVSFDDGSGPAVYAAGVLDSAGDVTTHGIARWNGSAWSTVGAGLSDGPFFHGVAALARFDDGSGDSLYAGGDFERSGSNTTIFHVARWNGTEWLGVGDGVRGDHELWVRALASFDDGSGTTLIAGGDFLNVGTVPATNVARWNGTSWSAMGTGLGTYGQNVFALAPFDDGNGRALYAGGDFTAASGTPASQIARWNGSQWAPLGSGATGGNRYNRPGVNALAVFDDGTGPALYAGGNFTTIDGVAASYVARWNGSAWSPVGGGVHGAGNFEFRVDSLVVYEDGTESSLVAAGLFDDAGGTPATDVARWNGTAWSPLGSGLRHDVHTLAVHDEESVRTLFAGGDFVLAGGTASGRIARWTPATAGSSTDGTVNAASGSVADVLFVNGSAGEPSRVVATKVGQPIELRLDRSPAGPGRATYAMWVWPSGIAGAHDLVVGGTRLGCTAYPTPLSIGATPQPIHVRRGGLGPEYATGIAASFTSPARAPWTLVRTNGFANPIVLTFQGVLADDRSANAAALSVTNAVTLRVHP